MRSRIPAMLLLAGVAGALCGRAAAASMHPFTLEELTYVADRIVVGTVTTQQAAFTPDAEVIVTEVEIDVLEVLKGPAGLQTQTVRVLGGEVAGIGMHVEGAPRFDSGETVLLFLEELSWGFTVLGWHQGTFHVEYSPELGTEVARPQASAGEGRAWALTALHEAIVADVRSDHVPTWREIPGLLPHKRAALRAHWGLPAEEGPR